ncbi:MAG: NTP transferase domain-containing protein [Actinomycetota bacterium]|jgi:molybdopterin-guanine dinucleotide biosynthesis protein A|nr:NTP transferase domain-containing protein [Actinomycetota bacterium]
MEVGALLLTGGRSRRMGRDKATLAVGGTTLAARTAAVLRGAGLEGPALEVGPGVSGLPHLPDGRRGAGPLAAVATGAAALRSLGWSGPALVVATDLPLLDTGVLRWLAGHPCEGSVVPVAGERPQWLCARYAGEALAGAEALAAAGNRAMRDLVAGRPLHLAAPAEWAAASPAGPAVFADVDEPPDFQRLGLPEPEPGGWAPPTAPDRLGPPPAVRR